MRTLRIKHWYAFSATIEIEVPDEHAEDLYDAQEWAAEHHPKAESLELAEAAAQQGWDLQLDQFDTDLEWTDEDETPA